MDDNLNDRSKLEIEVHPSLSSFSSYSLSRLFHSFIADGLMDFAGGKRIRFQHQSLSMFCPRMEVR